MAIGRSVGVSHRGRERRHCVRKSQGICRPRRLAQCLSDSDADLRSQSFLYTADRWHPTICASARRANHSRDRDTLRSQPRADDVCLATSEDYTGSHEEPGLVSRLRYRFRAISRCWLKTDLLLARSTLLLRDAIGRVEITLADFSAKTIFALLHFTCFYSPLVAIDT